MSSENNKQQIETMTADDSFKAVHSLKDKLEQNFVQLGQLFCDIKARKLFRFKGFDNFKDFVEAEFNVPVAMANKLSSIYELYFDVFGMDEKGLLEIGFDRLNMVKPYVAKCAWELRDEWMQKAKELTVGELKDHVKEVREKAKKSSLDVKDVLVEQVFEKMRTWFNCSAKELKFKLALYFQDMDLDVVRDMVKIAQRKFEAQITEHTEKPEGTEIKDGRYVYEGAHDVEKIPFLKPLIGDIIGKRCQKCADLLINHAMFEKSMFPAYLNPKDGEVKIVCPDSIIEISDKGSSVVYGRTAEMEE